MDGGRGPEKNYEKGSLVAGRGTCGIVGEKWERSWRAGEKFGQEEL